MPDATSTPAVPPVPTYEPFKPILDRILIRLVREDGPKDGFEVPEKYRQQTNKGEVLAVGDVVVLSGHKFPVTDFVNVGDHLLFGQYTAEEFTSDDLVARFGEGPFYIIRVQDVRGIARQVGPAIFGGGVQEHKPPVNLWASSSRSVVNTVDQVVMVSIVLKTLGVHNSSAFEIGQVVGIYSPDNVYRGIATICEIPKRVAASDPSILKFVDLPAGTSVGDYIAVHVGDAICA